MTDCQDLAKLSDMNTLRGEHTKKNYENLIILWGRRNHYKVHWYILYYLENIMNTCAILLPLQTASQGVQGPSL